MLSTAFAKQVDQQNDWKLLTIFTGMDDVVFSFNSSDTTHSPTRVDEFESTLDALLNAV